MLLFRSFFKRTVEQNKQISALVFLILNWLLFAFRIPTLDNSDSDASVLNTTKEKYILNRGLYFLFLDYIYT